MFSQFGPLELVLVLLILLVVFGPKRLPSLGRNLGKGMREFKDSLTGEDKERAKDEADEPHALPPAQPQDAARTVTEPAPSVPAAEPAPAEPAPAEPASERRG